MEEFFKLSVVYTLVFLGVHGFNLFEMRRTYRKEGKAENCRGTICFFGLAGIIFSVWYGFGARFQVDATRNAEVVFFFVFIPAMAVAAGWIAPLEAGKHAVNAVEDYNKDMWQRKGPLRRKLVYGVVLGAVWVFGLSFGFFSLIFS